VAETYATPFASYRFSSGCPVVALGLVVRWRFSLVSSL